jgi:proline iminopeptidase
MVPGRTPLVCLNGGLLYGHDLLWPALSPLAADRQLVLYDQRGRGESPPPPGPAASRIEHDAGDVRALREALGIPQWSLLGHSWGGGIAMLAAERDLEGTAGLVLVDSVGATSAWLEGQHATALARLDPVRRSALEPLDPADLHLPDPGLHSTYSRAFYAAWFVDQEFAQGFTPPRTISQTGSAIAARLRRDGYDWSAILSAIEAPTLVLHGESDPLPVAEAQQLAALIPGARLAVIPSAGHMPFWEAPDAFFDHVTAFLAGS